MTLPSRDHDQSVYKNAIYVVQNSQEEETLIGTFESEGTIGKNQNANIVLDDLRCEPIHALIEKHPSKPGFYQIIDLGSHFGTFVNEKRVFEAQLQPGDLFQIGTKKMVVRPSQIDPEKIHALLAKKKRAPSNLEVKKKSNLITRKQLLEASLYWGDQLLDIRTFSPGSDVSIGSGIDATFNVMLSQPKSEQSKIPIARYKKGSLKLKVPREANGLVWMGQEAYSIDKLRHEDEKNEDFGDLAVELRIGDRADIHFGELTLSFRFVHPSKKIPFQFPKIEKQLLKIFGVVLLLYASIFTWVSTSEVDPEDKVRTIKDIPKNLRKVLYQAGLDKAAKQRQAAIGQLIQQLEGGRARSEEGKSSQKKVAKPVKVKKQVRKAKPQPKPRKTTSRRPTPKAVKKAQPQKQAPALDLDAAFGSTSPKNSLAKSANLVGQPAKGNTASAIAQEGFARGRKGLGAGGGGQSVGIGQLKGYSTGGGMGATDYGLKPSKGREIRIPDKEEVVILGGLDPDVIAAIIRRYLPQIQHCYEQQLALNPNLKGKVAVAFTIGGSGRVQSAKVTESSLRNRPTERCIIGKVKNWKFPKPRGGGTVGVKYPFLLMSNSGS